jgi:hypothetical protein
MRRLVKKGIAAIFTDHPDRLLDILEQSSAVLSASTPVPAAASP